MFGFQGNGRAPHGYGELAGASSGRWQEAQGGAATDGRDKGQRSAREEEKIREEQSNQSKATTKKEDEDEVLENLSKLCCSGTRSSVNGNPNRFWRWSTSSATLDSDELIQISRLCLSCVMLLCTIYNIL